MGADDLVEHGLHLLSGLDRVRQDETTFGSRVEISSRISVAARRNANLAKRLERKDLLLKLIKANICSVSRNKKLPVVSQNVRQ